MSATDAGRVCVEKTRETERGQTATADLEVWERTVEPMWLVRIGAQGANGAGWLFCIVGGSVDAPDFWSYGWEALDYLDDERVEWLRHNNERM